MPWTTRIKIALDAAKGLAFLHDEEHPVIFRDFKASNILLDSVMDMDMTILLGSVWNLKSVIEREKKKKKDFLIFDFIKKNQIIS